MATEMRVKNVTALLKGEYTNVPADMLPDGASPDTLNVVITRGIVTKRPGLDAKGSGTLDENGRGFFEYKQLDGDVYLLCATEDSLYYLSGGTWTQIVADDFTGDMDNHFTFDIFSDVALVSNGKDPVKKWAGPGTTMNLGGGTGYQTPSTHVAKQVLVYANRVLLLNLKEDGVWFPQRVRYSNVGALETWSSTDYVDLQDKMDSIVGALRISQKLAIYKETSIVLLYYVGGDQIFENVTAVDSVGLLAPGTLKSVNTRNGEGHLFLSRSGVKLFEGSSYVHDVSSPIDDELLDDDTINWAHRALAFTVPHENLYVLIMPNGDGDLKRAYALNYKTGGWTSWTFATAVTGAMEYGAVGTGHVPTRSRAAILAQGTAVKEMDFAAWGDTDLEAYWVSKDFVLNAGGKDFEFTVCLVTVEAKGSGTMLVSHSTDQGTTWSSAQSHALTSSWAPYEYQVDAFTGNYVRFKISQASGSSGGLDVKRICIHYAERSHR